MSNPTDSYKKIFSISDEDEFNSLAIEIFNFQVKNNSVYNNYIQSLKVNIHSIKHYSHIPCLPISFFKTKEVVSSNDINDATVFTSSGTTGQITSKHIITDLNIYETSYSKAFHSFYGDPKKLCILALLPNYLQRKGSSLIYMFNDLIRQSNNPWSGFYLNNLSDLKNTIEEIKSKNSDLLDDRKTKVLLLGVTYALLDLAELEIELTDDFIVMETGGMKGNRPEMLKEELHKHLKEKFKTNSIHSEYGMTELLSQAYSAKDGIFRCPPWMRVLVRDVNDPFTYNRHNKTGGINVIDLANFNSCSFIETQDLGRLHDENTFEIMGRFDQSDVRGCNLMVI